MASFDQYNATFHEIDPTDVMRVIQQVYPFAVIRPDRAKHGYQVGYVFTQGTESLARVWWQGNPGIHAICHSHHANRLAPALRTLGPHQLTRGDVCEDFNEAGGFDFVAGVAMDYASTHGLVINQQGDWVRGQARTLYVGSRKSPVMLRLYEKGWLEGADPNWFRLEVEVKPHGSANRYKAATWNPGQFFAASEWLVGLLECLGWDHLVKQSIGTVYRPSDEERARRALAKQYGRIISQWLDDAGDEAVFVRQLVGAIQAVQEGTDALLVDS